MKMKSLHLSCLCIIFFVFLLLGNGYGGSGQGELHRVPPRQPRDYGTPLYPPESSEPDFSHVPLNINEINIDKNLQKRYSQFKKLSGEILDVTKREDMNNISTDNRFSRFKLNGARLIEIHVGEQVHEK